jgi:O-antigen ligase
VGTSREWIRDDQHQLILGGLVWMLLILMICPDGFNYALLSPSLAPPEGGAMSRLLWLGLISMCACVIVWRAAMAWLLLPRFNLFLLLFIGLAALSLLWSIAPGFTVRRLIRMFAILGVGVAFVLSAWHPRRFQNVVRPILTLFLAGSIVFGLVCPSIGIHSETNAELVGAWRGLTTHKNSLGALACVGVIFWWHAWLAREVRWTSFVFGFLASGACLILSRSSTSLITAAFVMMLLLMLMRSPRNLRPWMPLFITIFVAILLTYSLAVLRIVPGLDILLKPITVITGKDLTFSNRTEIWALLTEHIRFSPLLGSGYGAYWTGADPWSPSYVFLDVMYFYPGSAHNGYLEVVNDLGAVGLLIMGGYLIVLVRQSLHVMHFDHTQGALYLGLFFQQAISNLSETHWLAVMSTNFAIMTIATCAMARALLDTQLRTYFGVPSAEILQEAMATPDLPPSAPPPPALEARS